MPTLYGPHIPYKLDPTIQQEHNNWLEVERWACRLQDQVATTGGGCKVWFSATEPTEAAVGDFWYMT